MSTIGADSTRRAIIVMAKRPEPGRTKTRLAPTVSLEQAAELYELFLVGCIGALRRRTDCTVVVAIDSPGSADYFSTIAPGVAQVEQVGHALGDRLDAVMTTCLAHGFDHVFAIGSDSPDLPPAHLDAAFRALDSPDVDVVLGPTEDGGYYLVGYKQRWQRLLTDVVMSTSTVLEDTLAIGAELGTRIALAPEWYDVDDPADLARLRCSLAAAEPNEISDFLAALSIGSV